MPYPVIQHSYASPEAVAWVIHQKYELAIPLYRQEKSGKQIIYQFGGLHNLWDTPLDHYHCGSHFSVSMALINKNNSSQKNYVYDFASRIVVMLSISILSPLSLFILTTKSLCP